MTNRGVVDVVVVVVVDAVSQNKNPINRVDLLKTKKKRDHLRARLLVVVATVVVDVVVVVVARGVARADQVDDDDETPGVSDSGGWILSSTM